MFQKRLMKDIFRLPHVPEPRIALIDRGLQHRQFRPSTILDGGSFSLVGIQCIACLGQQIACSTPLLPIAFAENQERDDQ